MTFFVFRAHFVLAVLCFVAVPGSGLLGSIIRLRVPTRVSIGMFLALTGVAELLQMTRDGQSTAAGAVNICRIVALASGMAFFYLDQQRVTRRVANAFAMIRDKFDGIAVVPGAAGRAMVDSGEATKLNVGLIVALTISHALLGGDGEEPRDGALP